MCTLGASYVRRLESGRVSQLSTHVQASTAATLWVHAPACNMGAFTIHPQLLLVRQSWKLALLLIVGSQALCAANAAPLNATTGYVVAWGYLDYTGTPPVTTRGDIVKIAAGRYHALALTSNGTVIAWGDTSWNQTTIPAEAQADVVDIAAAEVHSLALSSTGSVIAWGDNTYGACDVPAELRSGSVKATAIAAGPGVSLAIVNGGVQVWGLNSSGQLSPPSDASSDIVAIAAGVYTLMAQRRDGTLLQWGRWSQSAAEVGQGVPVGSASFSSGYDQVAAVASDGSLAVWRSHDPPAYPSIINQVSSPPLNNTPGTYTAVSAGYNFTMALTTKGEVVAWGFDDGSGNTFMSTPVPAAARSNVISIAAGGEYHGLALVAGPWPNEATAAKHSVQAEKKVPTSGRVYAWGVDSAVLDVPVPPDTSGIVKISAGRHSTLALTDDGSVLGRGSDSWSHMSSISQHMGTDKAIDVSAGGGHNMVLLRNRTVRAWGSNTFGQCNVPDFGSAKVTAISAGEFHSLALLDNGTVTAWGASEESVDWNQTRVPEAARTDIVAIAAGAYSSLATTSNGTLIQWGNVMSDLPDVVKQKGVQTTSGSISAGYDQLVAILTDGTIAVWPVGKPHRQELMDQVLAAPPGRAVYVSAGYNFSAAVMETGEVLMWGGPSVALAQGLVPRLPVLQVAAGEDFAMVLIADLPLPTGPPGLLMAWGSNIPSGRPGDENLVIKASAGAEHVMELTANGTVRVWGNPARTDLLDTSLVDGEVVVDIAAGQQHCLALLRNGTVAAWGAAVHDNNQARIPASVTAALQHDGQIVGVAAGYYHSLALYSNSTVIGWGSNSSSEIYPPNATIGNTAAIAAGASTSFAVLRNGSGIVSWGATGQVPEAVLESAVSVAGGLDHSVAILKNGSVLAWASSSPSNPDITNQLLVVPATLLNATAVAASSYHSVALLASGQVVTWGAADNSTLTVPSFVMANHVLGVAAGLNFTLAIVDAGLARMQQLNGALGCDSAPNQYGYKCNRAITDELGDWQLSYTVSITPVPPTNLCTVSFQSTAVNQQLPAGATHWVHFMLSSTTTGWIAMSYPDVLGRMYPAKAILGHTNSNGGSIHTYTLTGYNLPARDNSSWANNMGAATSSDGHSIICFTQPATWRNSTHSRRRLHQAIHGDILDLNQNLQIHVASSPVPDVTQKHTVVGAVTVGLITGNQTVVRLTRVATAAPVTVTGSGSVTQNATGSKPSNRFSAGAIAGVAVAAAAVVAVLLGSTVLWLRSKQRSQHQVYKYQAADTSMSDKGSRGVGVGLGPQGIPGLLRGDVFLAVAAKKYGWITSTALGGPLQAVEAGVNDMQLDAFLSKPGAEASCSGTAVVALSRKELRDHVKLLSDGLLGRGATALVFKCLWPSRFGPNALLAAKVMKDGFDGDMRALESFTYEATVLSSAQHPNVVRMYGYCLEPPTLCLILELLPTSLKDVLYKGVGGTQLTGTHTSSKRVAPTPTTVSHSESHWHNPVEGSGNASISSSNGATPSESAVVIDVSPADGCVEVQVTETEKGKILDGDRLENSQGEQPSVPLPPDEPCPQLNCLQVVRLATDTAAGLAYLHSSSELPFETTDEDFIPMTSDGKAGRSMGRSRIVHRDMKPANILINSQGVAKISDFGLARQHEHTTVATVHLGVGTLPYMAPELLVGARAGMYGQAATNRVDIYSLAMMMWEMLSGCPPWKDMGEIAILAAVSQRQRPPLLGDMTFKDTAALQEVANQPASPAAIPQLNKLIRACWNQRDLKRPQAREVYAKLVVLLADMQGQQPGSTPTATNTSN